jgi:hypothetical protein
MADDDTFILSEVTQQEIQAMPPTPRRMEKAQWY